MQNGWPVVHKDDQLPYTIANIRWDLAGASTANDFKDKWERGPPRHFTKKPVRKTPNVVDLCVPVEDDKSTFNGVSSEKAKGTRQAPNKTNGRLNETKTGKKLSHSRTRSATGERIHIGNLKRQAASLNRPINDTLELCDRSQSVNSFTHILNQEKVQDKEKERRVGSGGKVNANPNQVPKGKSPYPKSYSVIQDMVKNIHAKRIPSATGLKDDGSVLTQLSLQGKKDFIDPVLALSCLRRIEEDCPFGRSVHRRVASAPVASKPIEIPAHYIDDEDDWVDFLESDEETMETISITPFLAPAGEEEDESYQGNVNYNKRTGQILNYYAEKETKSGYVARRDRFFNKQSKPIPSVTKFYRSLVSELAKETREPDQGHTRSNTIAVMTPVVAKTPVSVSLDGTKSSTSGRVFMGRRIHPPQKIEAALRPKLQKRGKSFVQIHKPVSLIPRSNTMDYSYRTCSVLSNGSDENDGADADLAFRGGQNSSFITEGMGKLSIVGRSLHRKNDDKSNKIKFTSKSKSVKTGHRLFRRSSSRNILKARSEVHTQMETISPPHSSENSINHMNDSSKENVDGAVDDLCVYNHINPSPRLLASNISDFRGEISSGPTSFPTDSQLQLFEPSGDLTAYIQYANGNDQQYDYPELSSNCSLGQSDDISVPTRPNDSNLVNFISGNKRHQPHHTEKAWENKETGQDVLGGEFPREDRDEFTLRDLDVASKPDHDSDLSDAAPVEDSVHVEGEEREPDDNGEGKEEWEEEDNGEGKKGKEEWKEEEKELGMKEEEVEQIKKKEELVEFEAEGDEELKSRPDWPGSELNSNDERKEIDS